MKKKESLGPYNEVNRWILHHLIANPEAKDTAEGIRKWWIPMGYPEPRQEDIEKILESLVMQDWLTVRVVTQHEKLYGLNREFIDQIKSYLNYQDDDR